MNTLVKWVSQNFSLIYVYLICLSVICTMMILRSSATFCRNVHLCYYRCCVWKVTVLVIVICKVEVCMYIMIMIIIILLLLFQALITNVLLGIVSYTALVEITIRVVYICLMIETIAITIAIIIRDKTSLIQQEDVARRKVAVTFSFCHERSVKVVCQIWSTLIYPAMIYHCSQCSRLSIKPQDHCKFLTFPFHLLQTNQMMCNLCWMPSSNDKSVLMLHSTIIVITTTTI